MRSSDLLFYWNISGCCLENKPNENKHRCSKTSWEAVTQIPVRTDGDLTRVVPDGKDWFESENISDGRDNGISWQNGCGEEREKSQGYLLLF